MTWVDVGVQTGRQPESGSVSVVPASSDIVDALNEIRIFAAAIAATKGTLADLRVSVVNTPATTVATHAVTQSGAWNLGSVSQVGALNWSMNNSVPNWQNQTYTQAFTNNIVRL